MKKHKIENGAEQSKEQDVRMELASDEIEVVLHALETVETMVLSVMEQEPEREMNEEMLRLCALRKKLRALFPEIPAWTDRLPPIPEEI